MSRKTENWLLIEWTDGAQNVVYVKSVLSPDIKKLKIGESITVNWQGEPKPAVLKERSCNRDELEAKTKINQPGPSSEPGSNNEEEDFSASVSSWVPSDDGALSNDSDNEKPAKKVKLEKTKYKYVNRRTSKKVIIPSHRANAVIPKKMQNQERNSKKNDSGHKQTRNETVRNNSFNKTVPDSTIIQKNNKKKSKRKNRCSLDLKELQEIGDAFRSLFQTIRELKKPYLETTSNISNPNMGKNLYQNALNPNVSYSYISHKGYQNTSNPQILNPSRHFYQNTSNPYDFNPNIGNFSYPNPQNPHEYNPDIGHFSYPNTPNPHVLNPNIGNFSYQNTSNPHGSNPNIGKKLYRNTRNSHDFNPNTGNFSYENTSNKHVSEPNIGKKLYRNTRNAHDFNPDIGNCSFQNTSNTHASDSNFGKKLYRDTRISHDFNPDIGNCSYQNTSNPHVSEPNIDKRLYQNTSSPHISDPNIEHFPYQMPQNSVNNPNVSQLYEMPMVQDQLVVEAIDPTEEEEEAAEYVNEEFNRSDDNVLITNKHDNKQYSRKSSTNNKSNSRKPTAGTSKEEEWVAIGSGKTLIPADEFRKVNWKSYTVATRSLLLAVFPRKVLATHSLTGKKSPAFQDKPAKMCLDPKIISDVIMEIQDRFDVRENLIRSIITTKCADECKMMKMRKNKQTAKKGNRENVPPNVKSEEEQKGK